MIKYQPDQISEADLRDLLFSEARRINSPSFIADDPVQFPRRFTDKRDIEIAALVVSSISWGNRKMIVRDADALLSLMDNQPYRYVMEEGYEELPPRQNIHRTFFTDNLQHYLRGLRAVYVRHASLEDWVATLPPAEGVCRPWAIAEALNREFAAANGGRSDSRCLPLNMSTTALKRLNMALRWLVRDDGVVDMGVWRVLRPAELYIPLDVHVVNTATELGLLDRKAADRRNAVALTERLRPLLPEDPALFDFALFGIGMGL